MNSEPNVTQTPDFWPRVCANSFFQRIDPEALGQLSHVMFRLEKYAAGQIIAGQDSPADKMFLILAGEIQITKTLPEGRELEIAQRAENEFVGEMSLMEGLNRSANILAKTACELAVISRDDFLKLLQQFPTISATIALAYAHHLRQAIGSSEANSEEQHGLRSLVQSISAQKHQSETLNDALLRVVDDYQSAYQQTQQQKQELSRAYDEISLQYAELTRLHQEATEFKSGKRKLAAIIFTDIVGYTRTMEQDEKRALGWLEQQRGIIYPLVEKRHGRVLKEIGDGTLIMFDSAISAVWCAVEIQNAVRAVEGLRLRIGAHIGDVVLEKDDILGSGVNIASRIESSASPGGISISEDVWRQIRNHSDLKAVSLGQKELKGVEESVEVYKLVFGPNTVEHPLPPSLLTRLWRQKAPHFLIVYIALAWLVATAIARLADYNAWSPNIVPLSFAALLSIMPTVFFLTYYAGRTTRQQLARVKKIGIPLNAVAAAILLFFLFRQTDFTSVTREQEAPQRFDANLLQLTPQQQEKLLVDIPHLKATDLAEVAPEFNPATTRDELIAQLKKLADDRSSAATWIAANRILQNKVDSLLRLNEVNPQIKNQVKSLIQSRDSLSADLARLKRNNGFTINLVYAGSREADAHHIKRSLASSQFYNINMQARESLPPIENTIRYFGSDNALAVADEIQQILKNTDKTLSFRMAKDNARQDAIINIELAK